VVGEGINSSPIGEVCKLAIVLEMYNILSSPPILGIRKKGEGHEEQYLGCKFPTPK
jgi:hypothetical protein